MVNSDSSAFRIENRPDEIAVLIFDTPGQKVNTFTPEILQDLSDALDILAARPDLKGLVLTSGKPGNSNNP